MSQMDEALEQAGRYLTEPHVQVVHRSDAEPAGPEDNPRAAEVLGKRAADIPDNVGVIPFDQPAELGYHCPVCVYENVGDREFDERLTWSEYRAMLWCYVCQRDYPSALCLPDDPERATEVFLDSITQAVARRAEELQARAARWAHELAEAQRTAESLTGDTDENTIGESLPSQVARVYGVGFGHGWVAGDKASAANVTAKVLMRALKPTTDDPADPLTHAVLVRERLADDLGWTP